MRTYKFRAWDGELMHNVSELHFCMGPKLDGKGLKFYGPGVGSGWIDGENIHLMQFTGLHDKNGKEIYESDIVRITGEQEFDVGHTCRMNDKAVVKWDEKECGCYLDVINKRRVNFSDFESTSIETFPLRKWAEEEWWIEYEVVGNIYEQEQTP